MSNETKYPEAEKISAVREESRIIGSFLEWLFSSNLTLCQWREDTYYNEEGDLISDKRPMDYDFFEPAQYVPVRISINDLLAEYYEINLARYEEERTEMFKELYKKINN